MENSYKTHRRTTYRFKISTQAQAGGYPSSLNCHVTHHLWIPKGKRLDSRRIIGPLTGEVELNVFFKLGRKSLEPEAFIKSSLFAEIINSLNTLATDEAVSIQRVGETKVVSDSPKAHACVQLKLTPLEEILETSLTRRPIARLSSIDLEWQYTPAKKNSTIDAPATPCGETIDFDSLIHVQPLVLPLKSSLQQFMKRFVSRNLLHQLPLVFNSQWQKKLQDSMLNQKIFGRILTRFSEQCISDDIRAELRNMCEHEDEIQTAKADEEECSGDKIASRLSTLQINISKLPNTRIARSRRCRNSSYCSSLDIEAVPSDHEAASDHGDVWMDEEEDQNIMADKENNSDVSLYLTGGSDNDIAMSSS
ncbi:hypothetical protein PGT21_021794 [Puccinia graminis f. sp. tritici]|uniref:Uncharacterized protein n=1 Tax=Puccinia graminis f. sp. tritici TaxID=56615 RepID=A0A5B0LM60_PUCGR|nr:hypothetical protein PGT21_021794 [Puccinia graminis f. sp. tritici]KAA1113718.1 hypothetical protein PGTUg99_000915 [Puccinia graminis f. sp. tritici]